MGTVLWVAEFLPYLAALVNAGGNVLEAIEWGEGKVKGWKESGTEPTDADIAEIRERRHANNEIINRG